MLMLAIHYLSLFFSKIHSVDQDIYSNRVDITSNFLEEIETILIRDNVAFIEINSGDIDRLMYSHCHFFILFKTETCPIVLQSYYDNYRGKINEWTTWKEDLQVVMDFNRDLLITNDNINEMTTNTTRINKWDNMFFTKYKHVEDSVVPVPMFVHLPK